jgi:isochorismate pyruvate lyase
MTQKIECISLEEVRTNIDRIDKQIITLLTERGFYVNQAARFKKTVEDVKAPQRVEQVISKALELSKQIGGNPIVVEKVFRAMISAFINSELVEHKNISEFTKSK